MNRPNIARHGLAGLLMLGGVADAATRYVSTSGTNSGDCDAMNVACATISYAKSRSFAGDTILVGRSTIGDGVITDSATIDFPLTIEGRRVQLFPTLAWVACDGDQCPTVVPSTGSTFVIDDGVAATIRDLNINDSPSGSTAIFVDVGAGLVASGLTLSENSRGIYALIDSSVVLSDSVIEASTEHGIVANSSGDRNAEVSITSTTFRQNMTDSAGGAIRCDAICNVSDSVFSDNIAADFGGAIAILSNGEAIVENSLFERNSVESGAAPDTGGAIGIRGRAEINQSVFSNNHARDAGGAISCDGNCDISSSEFVNNSADRTGGGAIFIEIDALATIDGSEFRENSLVDSLARGGAISARDLSQIEVTGSSFSDHSSNTDGGAIYVISATDVAISDSIFLRNSAAGFGGALALNSTDKARLVRNEYRQNTANVGGAIYSFDSDTEMLGSVLTDNFASGAGGAVAFWSGLSLTQDSRFERNRLQGNGFVDCTGGAISVAQGAIATVIESSFFDNQTQQCGDLTGFGGAIAGFQANGLTVEGGVFERNRADVGSAISWEEAVPATVDLAQFSDHLDTAIFVRSAQLSLDRSSLVGGPSAIGVYDGTTTISNSTLTDVGYIPAGDNPTRLLIFEGNGTANIHHSTLIQRNAGTLTAELSGANGTLILSGSALSGICEASRVFDDFDTVTDDPSCIDRDASIVDDLRLTALGDYGGKTRSFYPMADSPLLDRGLLACLDPPVSGRDQRDIARPFDNLCDAGSIEYNGEPGVLFADGFESP